MIQICTPEKAAKSLGMNPERAVLMPKFIMTFSKKENSDTFPRVQRGQFNNQFASSLEETDAIIISMIEEAK